MQVKICWEGGTGCLGVEMETALAVGDGNCQLGATCEHILAKYDDSDAVGPEARWISFDITC